MAGYVSGSAGCLPEHASNRNGKRGVQKCQTFKCSSVTRELVLVRCSRAKQRMLRSVSEWCPKAIRPRRNIKTRVSAVSILQLTKKRQRCSGKDAPSFDPDRASAHAHEESPSQAPGLAHEPGGREMKDCPHTEHDHFGFCYKRKLRT